MAAKMGSFRYNFAEKRERLLSNKGYSELGFVSIDVNDEDTSRCCSWRTLRDRIANAWPSLRGVAIKALQMGHSDPRKIVFSAKMGLALMLITLLIFLKQPFRDLGRYSVWAILTVVVVFEFSIGTSILHDFGFRLVLHLCMYNKQTNCFSCLFIQFLSNSLTWKQMTTNRTSSHLIGYGLIFSLTNTYHSHIQQ